VLILTYYAPFFAGFDVDTDVQNEVEDGVLGEVFDAF
jgi:hypothetical protein